MICGNASEMFSAMHSDIYDYNYKRVSGDTVSPTQYITVEAEPGRSYVLRNTSHNLVTNCALDMRWACANLLHFFSDTEDAEPLLMYNKNAARFLTGTKWIGAYGAIAMPQVWRCIRLLEGSITSRRAIISMGDGSIHDINRPACWSFVQFLASRKGLDMIVYQRSLLLSLMPYDCIVLTNMLQFVAKQCNIEPGRLRWSFGSLHMREDYKPVPNTLPRFKSLMLPDKVARTAPLAYTWLQHPVVADEPFRSHLMEPT